MPGMFRRDFTSDMHRILGAVDKKPAECKLLGGILHFASKSSPFQGRRVPGRAVFPRLKGGNNNGTRENWRSQPWNEMLSFARSKQTVSVCPKAEEVKRDALLTSSGTFK